MTLWIPVVISFLVISFVAGALYGSLDDSEWDGEEPRAEDEGSLLEVES